MKTLFILRHGDSGFDAPSDFDRVLSPEGRRDVKEVASRWAPELSNPSELRVECSAARRAQETALIALESIGSEDRPDLQSRQDLYLAGYEAWLRVIHELPDEVSECLAVGHNPGLSHLVERLSPGRARGLSTAAMVTLVWDVEHWQLIDSVAALDLRFDQPRRF